MSNTNQVTRNSIILLVIGISIIALSIFISSYANQNNSQTPNSATKTTNMSNSNGMMANTNNMMTNANNMSGSSNNMMMQMDNVNSDRSFIQYVVPHHQEAIDMSKSILATTQDAELKPFLNNVIATQSSEVSQLKNWYKQWFTQDYVDMSGYMKMMNLDGKTGVQAEKAYVQGMLEHHSGIIKVAQKVLADSTGKYKTEVKDFATKVVKDQSADNVTLQNWLNTKYKTV